LVVFGIGEPRQAHFLEHAADPLSELLAEAKASTYPRDARAPGEASERGWVRKVDDTGEDAFDRIAVVLGGLRLE
jgi:hypothetical protein